MTIIKKVLLVPILALLAVLKLVCVIMDIAFKILGYVLLIASVLISDIAKIAGVLVIIGMIICILLTGFYFQYLLGAIAAVILLTARAWIEFISYRCFDISYAFGSGGKSIL